MAFNDPFGLCPCGPIESMLTLAGHLAKLSNEWGTALGMLHDWATGSGPSSRSFGEGSPQVDALRHAPGTDRARDAFYAKNYGHIEHGMQASPLTNYASGFGLPGLRQAGEDATRQFVGDYSVEVRENPDATSVHFKLTNTTSMSSLLYHGPGTSLLNHDRSTFGPGGNMTQTYEWNEPLRSTPRQ